MKKIILCILAASALTLGFSSCSMILGMAGIKSTKSNPSAATSATPTLSAYKITAAGSRTDSKGNALAANAQPMGGAVSTALSRMQLYVGGATYGSSNSSVLDLSAGPTTPTVYKAQAAAQTDWITYPHASTAARLNAGGRQSVVSIVFIPTTSYTGSSNMSSIGATGTAKLVNWDGTTQTTNAFDSSQSITVNWLTSDNNNRYNQINQAVVSIAAGDIDGDGKDEIAFCVGNYFAVVDDDLLTILYQGYLSPNGGADADSGHFHPSCVAAGDIKNDGGTEFVTTYGNEKTTEGNYAVFGWSGSAVTSIASGDLGNGSCVLSYANVAIGDIDGSGTKDVVFGGHNSNSACGLLAADWDSATGRLVWMSGSYVDSNTNWNWNHNPVPALVCFCPSGTTATSTATAVPLKYDVLLGITVLAYTAASGSYAAAFSGNQSNINLPTCTDVVAGDVYYSYNDQGAQSQLISLSSLSDTLEVYGLDQNGAFGLRQSLPVSYVSPNYWSTMSLALADFEGKSLVLQYVSHVVKYSNPQVVAVLASPPYYANATETGSFGNGGTTFGTTTSISASESSSFTVSAGMAYGGEAEAPMEGDAAKTSDKVTITASVTAGFQFEQEMSYSHSYTTIAGQDSVIYTSVPFDEYTYTILSAPNSSTVGKTETMDYPQQPQLINMERNEFNSLPSNTLQIGSSVLVHTLGVPGSYASKSAIKAACAATVGGMYDGSGVSVSIGDGQLTTDKIEYTSTATTNFGTSIDIEAESENVVAGVLFGATMGLSLNFELTIGTSSSTEVEGVVPAALSTDAGFTFGVGLYSIKNTSIQPSPFLVATYWVQ